MNDFEGLLATDFGFKPSNKSAPMVGSTAASAKASANPGSSFDPGSRGGHPSRPTRASNSFSGPLTDDRDSIFVGGGGAQRSPDLSGLGGIVGGSARFASKSETRGADSAFNFDSMFANLTETGPKSSNSEPVFDKPVYDKPVYDDDDDDIFNGVPGLRSSNSKVKYEDVFASVSSSPPKGESSPFDDLLDGFGKPEPQWKSTGSIKPEKTEKGVQDFDDLLPGFGATSPPSERSASETNWPPETSVNAAKTTPRVVEDPFVVPGQFNDPLEEISKFSNSGSMKNDSVGNGRVFDDVDPFDGLKSGPSFTSERDNRGKETSNLRADSSSGRNKTFTSKEINEKPSMRSPDSQTQKKVPVDNDWDFEMPTVSVNSHRSTGQTMPPTFYANTSSKDANTQVERSEESLDSSEDIWLTVSEIPLFTQATSAPPPSRPPPPRPLSKTGISSSATTNARRKASEFSSFPNLTQNYQVPNSEPAAARSSVVSPIDELEDFVWGRSRDNVDEHVNGSSGEELQMNTAVAAMKEAMDRAEAKFRQAKEVRERENTKAARSKEGQLERDEKSQQDERSREKQERLERQRLQREREEEEMERRLEKERERAREFEREREEKEREQRRLEKERERAREIEKERGKARQAVERATREARERAAVEAHQRAERAKAERAAVDKATAEARERAERAAVQRAQAEARERAAAEAKERAEKAAAEARERASSEAKEREARERATTARAEAEARARAAERAAVERAAAEARERAAVEARERAAAAARANQRKNENDLDSFFGGGGRANSAPRPSNTSVDPMFDTQFQNRQGPEAARSSSGIPSNIKKANSVTNIVDDLTSIFNVAPPSGQFQDVEGESEERRRARLERHQRAQQRAAKALEEKNQRDLQNQREQAERHRIAETLDVEIKRWAAGKEGNLRALLSTLQYVLWPECGWQPVSLTDMITAASVKKVYRKATLCIHPDKVQQKGANLQQKYVAEKVFDLLKESWNKFNSEELF
ncbi:DnaJ domain containing protein [Parasponia andersonii]|uniref:DnaJ domain containing protein n=1 Tax=Parasponia andersonii TaxID=3476 RepID=A0A2P5AAZ6_PARAD|nr:DnaJ domain containing protein [Parasponia andersonii]